MLLTKSIRTISFSPLTKTWFLPSYSTRSHAQSLPRKRRWVFLLLSDASKAEIAFDKRLLMTAGDPFTLLANDAISLLLQSPGLWGMEPGLSQVGFGKKKVFCVFEVQMEITSRSD